MLKEYLFNFEKTEISPLKDQVSVMVRLNAAHEVFSGHFPGKPILPGVSLVQIIKDILSEVMKKDVMLVKSSAIKFLNIIDPLQHPVIKFDLKIESTANSRFRVHCLVLSEGIKFCNFKGEFMVARGEGSISDLIFFQI